MDMKRDPFPWTKLRYKPLSYLSHNKTTPMHTNTYCFCQKTTIEQQQRHSSAMATSIAYKTPQMLSIFISLLFVFSTLSPVLSLPNITDSSGHRQPANQTSRSSKEMQKLRRVKAYLKKINKSAMKTIQSADGDLIDCVLSNLQPAFDHPELKGQKPLDPPERPKWHYYNVNDTMTESFQLWTNSSESCPQGTVPIRRTTQEDVLRASTVQKFGRKLRRNVRRDSSGNGHEHAVVFVNGDQYYGAKATLNVWAPRVTNEYEFSLSQIWVISGSFGNDLNTIEAGWQVSPELYGDNYPRFFTYWTTDAYQATGCYNLLCSGFVQTNNKIAIGAAISPRSSYNGRQFDIGLMVWKDPKHGHWWLEFGSGLLVGYWPDFLFSHLRSHASMVQFGGEIVNSRSSGYHTSTQMGSGHFAEEGFQKASYFRNLQVVDWDNNLLPLTSLHLLADHPNCYDIRQGKNNDWGTYFYYGGPGRNVRCP
ncbi:DUF239 domain-containing protein/DUF4409 domain-containing protein [Cephalotus follicularis]|uniref:DUF239 domain-containing protein/DUF4409 domain-containing protein n=1 Tax=Cephalotus follicularis TaxID=3775 RepID=A0A1Q3ARD1_CEPFO|nr:DUF239 domain-containing protein/DUF4409 domain-containing protein [Cephalotus follicularis]